jgi:hypothetical protein
VELKQIAPYSPWLAFLSRLNLFLLPLASAAAFILILFSLTFIFETILSQE